MNVGSSATVTHTVTDADTAIAIGSGDVAVYGTPALAALFERAAVAAVGALDEAATSVGTRLELDHLAPSRVGAVVRATATVAAVDGRRLTLECEAHEGERLIGRCTHHRVIVERATFG
jgi:predicted thioesterase